MFRKTLLILLATLASAAVYSQDYVVNVNGIVCEFCSLGVAKKIRKLPFIDQDKHNKGVKVDIHAQMVTIAVREGATLNKAALYEAIESGGYNPVRVFRVEADGQLVEYAQ